MDSTIARGGRAIYGAPLGILMLEARFARIPGDMGNAKTWPFPVLYRVVAGASPERVVLHGAAGLRDDFLAAAATSSPRAPRRSPPTAASSPCSSASWPTRSACRSRPARCCRCPGCRRLLPPGKRVGVSRSPPARSRREHLAAAGVSADTPIVGTEGGREFFRVLILGEREDLDVALAEADILDAGRRAGRRHPDVGAIVLECTNMPPYARGVARGAGPAGVRHLFADHLAAGGGSASALSIAGPAVKIRRMVSRRARAARLR